jgi:hypothetical protein
MIFYHDLLVLLLSLLIEGIAPKMSATLKENAGHVIKYSGT